MFDMLIIYIYLLNFENDFHNIDFTREWNEYLKYIFVFYQMHIKWNFQKRFRIRLITHLIIDF